MVQITNIYFSKTLVAKQVEDTKQLLLDEWYARIKLLILKGTRKKHVPDLSKVKVVRRFYDSVAALMSQNLSDIAIRSLKAFTHFMCDFGVGIKYTLIKYKLIMVSLNRKLIPDFE